MYLYMYTRLYLDVVLAVHCERNLYQEYRSWKIKFSNIRSTRDSPFHVSIDRAVFFDVKMNPGPINLIEEATPQLSPRRSFFSALPI